MLLGNDDNVDGGLGVDAVKGEDVLIFIHDVGGDFVAEDFAEDGGIIVQ